MTKGNNDIMKGLRLLMGCLASLMLAACSTEDSPVENPSGRGDAIVLDVKEVAPPVTRAQHRGIMNFTELKTTGFGVYGYKGTYNASTSAPTLFEDGANTHVTFETGGTDPTTLVVHPGSWKYADTSADLKEWEDDEDYTFFAYAPYMASDDAELATGVGQSGIASISTGNGDPTIGYIVSGTPASSVDLLWGVRTDTHDNSGLPWKDVQRGQTASAVQFTFYHALCALSYHAQVIVDQNNNLSDLGDKSNLGTIGSKDGCKVTLKKVMIKPKLAPADGGVLFHASAYLNLNNTTAHQPRWTGHSGTYEGLYVDRDRGEIDPLLADPDLKPDKADDFASPNPSNYDVMTDADYDDEVTGVTESANTQTVIAKDGSGNEQFFVLIPQAAQDYTVTVEYFITYKTASGYHREAHTGTATITGLELVAGVKYYINLVIGLTTFKLSVDAVDWEETTAPVTIATETGTSASQSLSRQEAPSGSLRGERGKNSSYRNNGITESRNNETK